MAWIHGHGEMGHLNMSIGEMIMDFWYDTPELRHIVSRAIYTMGVSRYGRVPHTPEMRDKIATSRFIKPLSRMPVVAIRIILKTLARRNVSWSGPLRGWLNHNYFSPQGEHEAWGNMELLEVLRVHANISGFYIYSMKTGNGDHCLNNWFKWAKRRNYL